MKIQHSILSNISVIKLFQSVPDSANTLRFIGGCVRDILMEREISDIDLATPITPEMVINCLQQAQIKVIPTGIAHGTITACVDQMTFEITTLRQDIQTDGRHATVEFTDDWRQDALRRDFTINALSMDLYGQVYDYTGGIDDLKDKKLQFIGNPVTRIQEDYLRILRYFRFFIQLNWTTSTDSTLKIIRDNLIGLNQLSGERICSELKKILSAPLLGKGINLMLETGVLEALLGLKEIPDQWDRLRRNEETIDRLPLSWHRRLVGLLGNNRLLIHKIAKRLKFSTFDQKKILELVDLCLLSSIKVFEGVYRYGINQYQDYLLLTQSTIDPCIWNQISKSVYHTLRLPLTGRDLMDLGIEPGPEMGKLLNAIESWWIENNGNPTRDECIIHARKLKLL